MVIFQALMFLSLNNNVTKFLILNNFHVFGIVLFLAANNHDLERKKIAFNEKNCQYILKTSSRN